MIIPKTENLNLLGTAAKERVSRRANVNLEEEEWPESVPPGILIYHIA